MKLYIYRLSGCSICTTRQKVHNKIADYLSKNGIESIGVLFGNVDGETLYPLPEHDNYCRKADDPMKYHAPVYILDMENAVIRLPDIGNQTPEEYVKNVLSLLQQ